MDTKRLIVGLVVVALIAAACGGGDVSDPTTTTTTQPEGSTTTMPVPEGSVTFAPDAAEARLDIDRSSSPDAAPADLALLVAGDTAFAFDVFRAAADTDNLMLSPYSIASALTMAYAGARGETAAEMAQVLHIENSETVHPARNLLDIALEASASAPHGEDEPPPLQLEVANSVWGQRDYPFVEAFLETLATNYGAGLRLVDYVTDADAARTEINDWVEDQTNDRIVDLIPDGALTTDTRMTLVNAIWFKATWIHKFDNSKTTTDSFTRLDGSTVPAPTMHGTFTAVYGRGTGYQAVRLPYVGDASMTLIVPDAGRFDDVVAGLTPEMLADVHGNLSGHMVTLALPKFEFTSTLRLNELLTGLGMERAFQPAPVADFTGISPIPELSISDVLHKAFITLDEEGTEAAAATAVVVGIVSLPPEAELTIDRPFIFLITHNPTGEILFLGQVTDPTA